MLATQGRQDAMEKNAEDEDDYEVLDAALKEISEKQGTRKNKFERKVGEDGNLHWVAATPVTGGKMVRHYPQLRPRKSRLWSQSLASMVWYGA